MNPMDPIFQVHRLNEEGIARAGHVAAAFQDLLSTLDVITPPERDGWAWALMRTKLEEACFYAKKSLAASPSLQVTV